MEVFVSLNFNNFVRCNSIINYNNIPNAYLLMKTSQAYVAHTRKYVFRLSSSIMENFKATCYRTSRYENNPFKIQIHGQGGDYFYNSSVYLEPKSNQYHVSLVIGQRFMKVLVESYREIENIYSQP